MSGGGGRFSTLDGEVAFFGQDFGIFGILQDWRREGSGMGDERSFELPSAAALALRVRHSPSRFAPLNYANYANSARDGGGGSRSVVWK